jgi:transketolase
MRRTFIDTLIQLASRDNRIFLLTSDLGFSILESFRDEFPGRFLDAGVAEQNMIGVAAGLALSGKIIFVYSIIPFVTMRCFEHIRNDLCMHNLNVKLVGVGAGLHYGSAGLTHHAVEDIGVLRSLPNMMVISPAMQCDIRHAVKFAVEHQGPVYLRLGKSCDLAKRSQQADQPMQKAVLLEKGDDVTIISTGTILSVAEQVTEILKDNRVAVRLVNMRTIKPIDAEAIFKAATETKAIFTIEEHNVIGGLGSAVSEVLAELSYRVLFKRFALPDRFVEDVGDRKYLIEKSGLGANQIAKAILVKLNYAAADKLIKEQVFGPTLQVTSGAKAKTTK